MKILLIDNYDSFTYNLFHYISKIKKNVEVIRNDKIDGKTVLRKKYDKIVISPGPGNPNQAGNCLKIVKEVYKKIDNTEFFNNKDESENYIGIDTQITLNLFENLKYTFLNFW